MKRESNGPALLTENHILGGHRMPKGSRAGRRCCEIPTVKTLINESQVLPAPWPCCRLAPLLATPGHGPHTHTSRVHAHTSTCPVTRTVLSAHRVCHIASSRVRNRFTTETPRRWAPTNAADPQVSASSLVLLLFGFRRSLLRLAESCLSERDPATPILRRPPLPNPRSRRGPSLIF